jgi:glutamate--cysteine ligase
VSNETAAREASLRPLIEQLFRKQGAHPDGTIGAELELIPVRRASRQRVGIEATEAGPGTADVVRDAAREHGWSETRDTYGAPSWDMGNGGRISFEPGGQLEIISPVFDSHAPLAAFLRTTVLQLRKSADRAGVALLALGVDPYNEIESVALQLHAPRYDRMTRYFESRDPSGIRMMRQTASMHVSVELGPRIMDRWRLLNALAPYLTAAFANSSEYAGHRTGYASYRARLWQTLDPGRTGLPYSATDPVGTYARFAANAGRILDDDREHLTTLFPEVRPRGYFEIRSLDAMEPDRIAAALRFLWIIVHDEHAANSALTLLGDPEPGLLARAAQAGRSDRLLRERLAQLQQIVSESALIRDRP